ncbi:c-clamp [Homalodisca vitripennis]|nr:c-clamp [Homalodisca vitripennis]
MGSVSFVAVAVFQRQLEGQLEVRKRLEEVRLLESRKSARLMDQDTDFARLADMAGDRKRASSHVIDVPAVQGCVFITISRSLAAALLRGQCDKIRYTITLSATSATQSAACVRVELPGLRSITRPPLISGARALKCEFCQSPNCSRCKSSRVFAYRVRGEVSRIAEIEMSLRNKKAIVY